MTGDGSATPRLMYFAHDDHPVEGERVVTGDSGRAGKRRHRLRRAEWRFYWHRAL